MKTIYKILIITLFINISITYSQRFDYEVKSLEGKEISFSEYYKNGPLLINFWALWCEPCRIEMKELQPIFDEYKNKGFNLIGINQDSPRSLAKVKSFIAGQKISYTITLDPNNELFRAVNGQVIPLSLLIDKNGEVVYRNTGYLPGDEVKLKNEIEKLLQDNN